MNTDGPIPAERGGEPLDESVGLGVPAEQFIFENAADVRLKRSIEAAVGAIAATEDGQELEIYVKELPAEEGEARQYEFTVRHAKKNPSS